MTQRERFC